MWEVFVNIVTFSGCSLCFNQIFALSWKQWYLLYTIFCHLFLSHAINSQLESSTLHSACEFLAESLKRFFGLCRGREPTDSSPYSIKWPTQRNDVDGCVLRCWSYSLSPRLHTYIHTYIHTFIRTCKRTYIHSYVRTYIRTNVHTCIHTYIHACLWQDLPGGVCWFVTTRVLDIDSQWASRLPW